MKHQRRQPLRGKAAKKQLAVNLRMLCCDGILCVAEEFDEHTDQTDMAFYAYSQLETPMQVLRVWCSVAIQRYGRHTTALQHTVSHRVAANQHNL